MANSLSLSRVPYFAAVVEEGSFTRAAKRFGVSKTVISQQVARLEEELQTSLFVRTTRRVLPTDAGRTLHARCVEILRASERAVEELAQSKAEPTGTLRIAAPNGYGTAMIAPVAAAFVRRYPNCTVDLCLSDARTDIVAGEVDLAIRIGWLDDSTLHARRFGEFRQRLVASREHFGGNPVMDLEGVAQLPFIANGALRDPLNWRFLRAGKEHIVRMRPAMYIDTSLAALSATIAGGGATILPDFMADPAIADGKLIELLPGWSLPSGAMYAVYPPARFRPPKIAAFVNMLVEAAR